MLTSSAASGPSSAKGRVNEMAGEYKSACGCKIHVAQWTAKRKVVTQESCPLHKAAPKMFAALQRIREKADTALREDGGKWAKQALDSIDEISAKALEEVVPAKPIAVEDCSC
jgi:HJR/Mrr/RecB family endonuclease